MFSIELRSSNKRILIPVKIHAPFQGFNGSGIEGLALIDTGATCSGLKASVADHLGLHSIGKRPLTSAHGEGQAERYIFRFALIPDASQNDPPAYPYLFEEVDGFGLNDSFSYAAILGMDILVQCDLVINRGGSGRLSFG